MTIFAYLAMVVVGVSLGMIGGGGSILTLPILVYLFNVPPVLATGYSLFIVGISAAFGAVQYARQGLISYRLGLLFAAPAFIGVYVTRRFILPAIPESIYQTSYFHLSKDAFIMGIFAVLMLLAAIAMLREKSDLKTPQLEGREKLKPKVALILVEGLLVGAVTGLVGAGGGFLIIPALVYFTGLDIKYAIGTSLMIIAVKSLFGFWGDIGSGQLIDWWFVLALTTAAVIGIFLGSYLVRFVSSKKLKPAFGWFVLIMGTMILGLQIMV